MGEQEAETALLAMGPRLEWKAIVPWIRRPKFPTLSLPPGFVWEGARYCTDTGFQDYDVTFDPDEGPHATVAVCYWHKDNHWDKSRTQPDEEFGTPEYYYNSVAEAKTACEVHAATGQFPPSVERA